MVVSRSKIILLPMLTLAGLSSRGQCFRAGPTIIRVASRLNTPARVLPNQHYPSFQQVSAWRESRYDCPARQRRRTFLHSSSTGQLPEIETMRAGQIKQELESYGISTKSFLEKSELVDALQKARTEGLQPKQQQQQQQQQPASSPSATSSTSTGSASTSGSSTASSSSDASNKSREERLAEEMIKCQGMKATELKKELQERGISTAALFEKSEFVRAVAEARVDNVSRRKSSTVDADGEGYAEYKNVEVLTDDSAGPRQKQKQPEPSSASPFGGGAGSPFGGGAGNPFGAGAAGNPFGGMGGMGSIADMLKNMGMGGMGGGANPFGGAGGANPFGGGAGANPFGGGGAGMNDVMGKAQEMMKNPKVQELMRKAQSNPRIMAKVNECMTNPASFVKYQNDPDVAELIGELRKYM